MRRLMILLALPLLAVLAGCAGSTSPQAKDVTAFTGTMQATVQCNRGDTGYYYWRFRQVDTANEATEGPGSSVDVLHPWVILPHHDFAAACKDGLNPVTITQPLGGIPGAVIGQTVYQLKSGTHYAYELCGHWDQYQAAGQETCLDSDGGGHDAYGADQYISFGQNRSADPNADPFVGGQWGQLDTQQAVLPNGTSCAGCVWGPGKSQITDANGTVWAGPLARPPVANPYTDGWILNEDGSYYDPSKDPGQQWTTSSEETTYGGFPAPCPSGLACTSGNGPTNKTGWRCGDPPDAARTYEEGGVKMWRASMFNFRVCVGIGGNRGKFNWDAVYIDGGNTNAGRLVGWKVDGGQPVWAWGPAKLNGKLFWDRDMTFRLCFPPPWTANGTCSFTNARIAVIMKHWIWSNLNGVVKNRTVTKVRCIVCNGQNFDPYVAGG